MFLSCRCLKNKFDVYSSNKYAAMILQRGGHTSLTSMNTPLFGISFHLLYKDLFTFKVLEYLSVEISGDLERIKLSLQDSEAEKQTLRERIDDLIKAQHHLEQKATSLQLTVSFIFHNMNGSFR